MSIWRVFGKKANFNEIANKYSIDQVTARIIRNRNMISDEDFNMYLRPDISRLHDPFSMKDITKACDILLDKIDNKKSIRIIGDYDIDGICSITILYKGLKRAEAIVDYVVPHRIHDGYGINERLIDEAYEDGIDTIITCDNGIAALKQVKHAKSLGMTIIITDHHDIPFEMQGEEKIYTIPEADACVNPKQADCPYPFKGLCGAVVAYKLIQVLYAKINAIDEGKYKALYSRDLDDFLEFAAIATVGDVMDLINENRVIVKYGLAHIANTPNLGLSALIELCELDKSHISSYHIGFVIGPCLNASGRLESAELAIKMLLSTSENEAKELAQELKALNDERKDLTDSEASKAFEMVDNTSLKDDKVLVVYLENCHESIAGIIAGRVRERYYKPSIVITKSEDGLKGSGRSIEGYNMFEEISKVKSLLTKFGGH
nr:single-stranded-DNA-specific exonuclease RecJ [Lachnospira sp.]